MRNRRQPMTCTKCQTEIGRGEKYIADVRQHERVGRLGAINVEGVADSATYHLACWKSAAPGARARRASPRGVTGGVLLSAALLYATRDLTIPVCVLYAVLLVATVLLCRAYIARDRAVLRADEQQLRADALARRRFAPTVPELLHAGPRDQLVGHDDRDAVIAQLGDRYATGHLTPAEFEARATETTQARTRGQLAHVLRDLP